MKIAEEYIKNVEKLAPCPEVALDVLSLAHDADFSISRLAGKVERDPGLTANMLQMANSAYFGHMKKITSIKDIIVRLGLETVKIIAITSASVGLLKSPKNSYSLSAGELWRHSYSTALLASIIARFAQAKDSFAVYTAGLLHDIGKVVLDQPLELERLNQHLEEGRYEGVELERQLLHTDHAEVGGALLEKWGLPESITAPVALHHATTLPGAGAIGVKVVYLANQLTHLTIIDDAKEGEYFFDVLRYEEIKETLPEVVNFKENMRLIIDEFVEKYNETANVFVL
jgi:putative nucleotidyltransferase with HDIG domain